MTDAPPLAEMSAHTVLIRLQRLEPDSAVEVVLSPTNTPYTLVVTHDGRVIGKVLRFWGVPSGKDESESKWLWGAQYDHHPVKVCQNKSQAIRVLLLRGD